MKKNLVYLIILFIVTSCENYREVKSEQIAIAFILNSSPTFEGYFYEGSDDDCHYFTSRWRYAKDEYFKIPVDRLKISPDFKFDKGKKDVRIDLIDNGNKQFAENEFYKLFVIAE